MVPAELSFLGIIGHGRDGLCPYVPGLSLGSL